MLIKQKKSVSFHFGMNKIEYELHVDGIVVDLAGVSNQR